ncbi:DUF5334 family protein [Pseudomonas lundensis]|uniref:DUF5666 domain-containing protein n=1 Tax=Pseudomonas lundensis TaxID=86185 RepID=A0AAX2HDN3_9PSED|nr:DUF5334 family protein [Pseudomonas lundensis]SOB54773.1 conserved exported hypothetical protein [Pseudomonas lundensis]
MSFLKNLSLAAVFTVSGTSYAWDGYDSEASSNIEIESGNLVRPGETIDYYDHGTGDYKSADVESINSYGSTVDVEVYDHDSGEYRTFEMEY